MKTTKILTILVVALGLIFCLARVSEAVPMGTAFTYQGRLIDANSTADGLYDFAFKLYDANVGGSKVGIDVNVADVETIDGYFTVELGFYTFPFLDGEARWLEIGVRPGDMNDPNVYTILEPRQEVTPTPYALHTWGLSLTSLDNTLVGIGAGANNTANYGTFVGHNAGYNNQGKQNTFLGDRAGLSNTTGFMNTFLGHRAGYQNTTGYDNTFLGNNAGNSNTTGNHNTFLGNIAGISNTTGYDNTFLGESAGLYNTTGTRNTFLGYSAGYSNTIGYYNTFLGESAGLYNTTGDRNTFSGNWAGRDNTTGSNNTFLGNVAGVSNTTGDRNTFLGYSAGLYNTTGNYNSAVGYYANLNNQEGSKNTIIGYEAGRGPSLHNKSGNVFIGYRAGYNETGDNKLYIANDSLNTLIYGDFSTGRVGIGTTSPGAKLHVRDVKSRRALDIVNIYTGSIGQLVNIERTADASGGNDLLQIKAPSTSSDTFQFIECERGSDVEFKVNGNGEVYADGSFHSGGADIAEMLPATVGLEPGDVLVIGADGKLARSSKPYVTNIIGVYSTSPGFVGGDGDDDDPTGKVPLAVLGVVPVKASAENGAIHPGDLLVTSGIPGYAMRDDNPKVGTVLGKAFGSLGSGTGVINVLVMLQ